MTGSAIRVLLVDDNHDDYELMRSLFAELPDKYTLDCVGDFECGLRELKQCVHDVYLIDYHLGDRDALEWLRESVRLGCQAPVIILTGQADRELDFAAMRAGAADCLIKGKIDSAGIERALRYALQQKGNELELESRVKDRTAELTKAVEAVRHWSEQMQKLSQLATHLNAAHDIDSVMGIVTRSARQIIGADGAAIRLASDSPTAESSKWLKEYTDYAHTPPPFSDAGMDRLVCGGNKSVRLAEIDLAMHPEVSSDQNSTPLPPMRSWLAAPLVRRDGRNLGLVQLTNKCAGEFSDADEAILTQLAQLASGALENARLYQHLHDRDRRKDEFLAMLAHELRNPLAPIRNAVQILEWSKPGDSNVATARDLIARQVKQLVRLVDDLLDVSRITRGKINLIKSRVDIGSIIGIAVESCRPLMSERRHTLEIDVPSTPIPICADVTRLSQVILNLLNNAAKYTDEGGHIRLGVEEIGAKVVIRVRDNGTGIADEMLPTIFDLFTQVDRTLDRSQGGLGLGLTLARRLTEMHGGRIEACSEGPGKGSEFIVTLPRLAADSDDEVIEGGDNKGGDTASTADKRQADEVTRRVLVVDDNRDSAESLAVLLRVHGHVVHTIHDGRNVMDAAAGLKPDVFILDIGLPGVDGYELARRLRQSPASRGALLVALTGYGSEEDRRACYQSGFDAHFVKPVDIDALFALLSSFLVSPRGGA